MSDLLCPCGTGLAYGDCCGRYHQGEPAPTAVALMRSRYSAYVLQRRDYLLATWHPKGCPAQLDLTDSPQWLGLTIRETLAGGEGDREGEVEFEARFAQSGGVSLMHERSRFRRLEGRWVYLDGRPGTARVGRNDPCPCGSGKKFKRCCGAGR